MTDHFKQFWKSYLANTQVDISVAAYTKVTASWRDIDFVPDFSRFYFIKEGEGYLKLDGVEYYPKPNQLFMLPQGVMQSYSTISDNTFTKYWCHFTATLGDLSLFRMMQLPAHIEVEDPDKLTAKFEELIRYYSSDELTSGFRVKSILLELLSYFIEKSGAGQINLSVSASAEKINDTLKYIEQHLAESLSVEELAKVTHFHPNYFIQVFKNFTGVSPIQYVNRRRIERAKHLLATTDRSISDIADEVGLQMFYFSRMFKEQTGFSPTSYRSFIPKKARE